MGALDDDNATVRQKRQAKKTQIALNSSEAFRRIATLVTKPLRKDQTMSMRQNMREIISRNMRRPVPISTRLPPALQRKSMKHRGLACRWHLAEFPLHYRYMSNIGLHMYLDDLRSLSQKHVSYLELRKIRIALTALSSIPELYCPTDFLSFGDCDLRSIDLSVEVELKTKKDTDLSLVWFYCG